MLRKHQCTGLHGPVQAQRCSTGHWAAFSSHSTLPVWHRRHASQYAASELLLAQHIFACLFLNKPSTGLSNDPAAPATLHRRSSLTIGLEQAVPLMLMRAPSLSMPPATQRPRSMSSIPGDDDSSMTLQPRVASRFGVQAARHSAPPLQLQEPLGPSRKEPRASARSIGSVGSPSSMGPLGASALQQSLPRPEIQQLKDRARAVLQQPAQALLSARSSGQQGAAAGSRSRPKGQQEGAQIQGGGVCR
jgi:hypothetical protein